MTWTRLCIIIIIIIIVIIEVSELLRMCTFMRFTEVVKWFLAAFNNLPVLRRKDIVISCEQIA